MQLSPVAQGATKRGLSRKWREIGTRSLASTGRTVWGNQAFKSRFTERDHDGGRRNHIENEMAERFRDAGFSLERDPVRSTAASGAADGGRFNANKLDGDHAAHAGDGHNREVDDEYGGYVPNDDEKGDEGDAR